MNYLVCLSMTIAQTFLVMVNIFILLLSIYGHSIKSVLINLNLILQLIVSFIYFIFSFTVVIILILMLEVEVYPVFLDESQRFEHHGNSRQNPIQMASDDQINEQLFSFKNI